MNTKLKVLYLDFNLFYINPTRNLIGVMLKHSFDVTFFGPGYVKCEILKKGLKKFIERLGPFNFVIATEHIMFSSLWNGKPLPRGYRKNYAKRFDDKLIYFGFDIYKSFLSVNAIKCAMLFESDFYNFTEMNIQILEEFNGFIIAMGEQFIRPIEEMRYIKYEKFYQHANDNWYNFIKRNKGRIVSLPAFVSDKEFSWSPLKKRQVSWSILGSGYWARKKTQITLRAKGICCTKNWLARSIRLMDKFNLRPYSNLFILKNINYLFRKLIECAKYAYTCGSGLGYPVRKFFEIPALGAVLVCLPCNGFNALGFKDKVNALVSFPSDIIEAHKYLENNPKKAQTLANAGRVLIWEKHISYARSEQLYRSFLSISSRRFAGSYWKDGEFFVIEN